MDKKHFIYLLILILLCAMSACGSSQTDEERFLQMMGSDLTDGMGYAKEKIGDTEIFFVSCEPFDNPDGTNAAADAALFLCRDGDDTPIEIGKLASGGTAYPLIRNGDYLYTGSHHWVCKYTIADDRLSLAEKATVTYDATGNETYDYEADEGGSITHISGEDAERKFDALLDEMLNGKIIAFSTVHK